MVEQIADHVPGPGGHLGLAVLVDMKPEVVRIGNLVRGGDPRTQTGEGIETLADVARVLAPDAPGIALAEVPENQIAEDMTQGLLRADLVRGPPDDGAQFALEIHVPGNLGQDHVAARADDGARRLQEKL